MGIAESSCKYQEEAKTVAEDGNVMSVDCRLGAPSLSVSCSNWGNLSRCEEGVGAMAAAAVDTTALEGLEIWTRVVEARGTPHGMSYEEVSMKHNEVSCRWVKQTENASLH